MKKFEVLCVTMNKTDFSLFHKMNLQSDAVFANQAGTWSNSQTEIDGYSVKMFTTDTRGVGVNRNIALLNASAEICLLSDDDMVYNDGYAERICEEFQNHPEADVIIFNIGTSTPEIGRIPTVNKDFKRLHRYSRNPYGAPRIAFRLASVKRENVMFSTLFGGGCPYKTGEDTIWLNELMEKGIKVYLSPVFIGDVSYAESSTYSENIRERLYDHGALLARNKLRWLYIIYYSFFRNHDGVNMLDAMSIMRAGVKGFSAIKNYKQYVGEKK